MSWLRILGAVGPPIVALVIALLVGAAHSLGQVQAPGATTATGRPVVVAASSEQEATCAIFPDPNPRQCPDGLQYLGRNGGFEDPPGSVNNIDHWYDLVNARRATVPVHDGQFSLALNPFDNQTVSQGNATHDIDLSRSQAPADALLTADLWWDGSGTIRVAAALGGLSQVILVDSTLRPPPADRWQTLWARIERGLLAGVQPLSLRWSIRGRSQAYLDNVTIDFCCPEPTPEPYRTPTPYRSPTPSPSPTETVSPTATFTPETPTITPSDPTATAASWEPICLPYASQP